MSGMHARKLDGRFVRFRPAVAEKAATDFSGSDLGQLFSQGNHSFIRKQRGGVLKLIYLGLDLGGDPRIAVTHGNRDDSTKKVEVLVALQVPQILHGGMIGHQRIRVISRNGGKEVLLLFSDDLFFSHDSTR